MPSLADLLENYRNWKGRQDWQSGKEMQDYFGGDPVAQEQFDRLSGFGTADLGGLSGLAGAIKASHGSPHAFEKFDFSKIGTGEGAQAYGHGGYFGQGFDSPVAQSYRTAGVPGNEYQDKLFLKQYHADNAKSRGDEEGEKRALAALEDLKANLPGHMYNVELKWPDAAREAADPLGEHHLLDWDAPISEQPETTRKHLMDLAQDMDLPIDYWHPGAVNSKGLTGEDLYNALQMKLSSKKGIGNPQEASSELNAWGIPGIRYLDQGSRGQGAGTRNYVMFDDQTPNIVSRNGASLSDLLDTSYQSGHTAPGPDFGAPLHDLTGGGEMYPQDIYSKNAARLYGHGGSHEAIDKKAMSLVQMLRNQPEALVDIYRAVPKNESISSINPGDWVTITKEYAKEHGEGPLRGDYKILKQKVPAKSIWTNADSIHEYGYWPD